MDMPNYYKRLSGLVDIVSRFRSDRSAAAAVEFVLVVPLIVLVYLGAVDLSGGIETDKNVSRAAGIIADIVAQQSTVSKTQLDDIFEIGEATIFPYDRAKPGIKVTAIQVAASPQTNPPATVAWSYSNGKLSPDTKGRTIDIPVGFRTNGTYLIKVEVALTYVPVTAWGMRNLVSADGGLPLSETYYLSPRLADTACSNC
ncbi:TadE/TadG family type IV pilus assembly protein [Mesorhizobium sp. RMAD-H1]|uniref:TadE/TadG family type IV pilus assembly protein n=1 Tax=Mesorhizobium sp. RMAD-H1 TaxID=2587065 RepID=UPI001610132E|nr:TadE/TadG family type IV pilus assembly protein [Mesorhizobium sp. RMAD-H1]MBB2971973.1 Flp pilus assembly protein TadG [Mesorhizobium sp. RMAD-H1]